MERFILETTALFFVLFLLSQTVLFRIIPERFIVRWLIKIYLLISAVVVLVSYQDGGLDGLAYCYFLGVVMTLLWLLWFIYMMTVYSYIEASITVRLFMEIAAGGVRGVTRNEILHRYNPQIVVERRISRLVESGELVKTGDIIRATNRMSAFQLRDMITKWYFVLFPR